jgi:hypothetical protein
MEMVGRLAQLPAPVPFISAGAVMPYVIAGWCIDVMDRSCMEEYEGVLGAADSRGRVKVHDLESVLRYCAGSV